ncbi:hypothetical protein SNE510_77070 [Streptomyces sp. NE5-10]|nr:hypothetical protein SNE510_77070 [Streptomyces sp. NE5-10]
MGSDGQTGQSWDQGRGGRTGGADSVEPLRADAPHGGSGEPELVRAAGAGAQLCGAYRGVVAGREGEDERLAALLAQGVVAAMEGFAVQMSGGRAEAADDVPGLRGACQ